MASKRARAYFEEAAEHSGSDTSDGGSGSSGSESESDDSIVCSDNEVEYESGAGSSDEEAHAAVSKKQLAKHRAKLEAAAKRRRLARQRDDIADALAQTAASKPAAAAPPSAPAASSSSMVGGFSQAAVALAAAADHSDASSASDAPPPSPPPKPAAATVAAAKPVVVAAKAAAAAAVGGAGAPPSYASTEVKPKLASNKVLHESAIPPKPKGKAKPAVDGRKFAYRMHFTNGAMFHKFLLPVANAVHELRFNLTVTPDFTGLRLEAHDTYLTLANKSRYECGIDGGVDAAGAPLSAEALTGMSICVSASSFMQTLGCATLKDTVLTITNYIDAPDQITFEAITNESDVQTVYSCALLAESRLESLKGMQFNLGYHVNLFQKTLKEQTANAKRCGAPTIYFRLFQAEDPDDDAVVHSRLSVGFKGTVTSGSHDFYQSARKIERTAADGSAITEWEPLAGLSAADRARLKMEERSYNEYDNAKLRLFLNHMDVEWVLVHLCNDGTQKPLVLECMVGGKNTKHTIIVAPKVDGSAGAEA